MRISTDPRVAAAQRARAAAPKPTLRKRGLYFLLGAALGAIMGYGLLTTQPQGAPPWWSSQALRFEAGGALLIGVFTALAADRFWRSNTKYGGWTHGDD